jgi:hypothetical protein
LGKQDSFGSRLGVGLGASNTDTSIASNNAYGNENQAAGANAGGVLQPVPPAQPSYGTRYARQARYAPGMGSSSKSLLTDAPPNKSSAYPGVGVATSAVQGPSAAGGTYDYSGASTGFGGARRLSNGSGGLRNGALVSSTSAGASGGGSYGGGVSALGGGDSLQAMLQHQGSWKMPAPLDSRSLPGNVGSLGDLSSQSSSAMPPQGGMRFGFGRHRVPGP